MDKLKLHTSDLTQENIARLAELFPNCVTEAQAEDGGIKRAIDFDQLRQELSDHVVDGPRERYHLNWPGKREALLAANAPIAKTLRPCREESVDFDTTKNLFVEGDNLDALKLLQDTYLNKVKLIYIDPPYNTGHDFIYDDDFCEDREAYLLRSNQKGDEGMRLIANAESNGRFHSDWLSTLYPRLRLSRNLLTDNGAIFISIDDREVASLRKVCDEVFGDDNFVANIVWQKKYAVSNDDPGIAPMHDHILVYRKTGAFSRNLLPRTDKQLSRYKNEDNDPRGPWSSDNYVSNKSKSERPTLWYPIKHPRTGADVWPSEDAVWRYSKEKHAEMVKEHRLYWGPNESYEKPRLKRFLSEIQDGIVPSTWWDFDEVGHNDEGQKETGVLLGKKVFSTPKPVRLLKRIVHLATSDDDLCLDFYSGSSATAHAVMSMNADDGGARRFIMVQLPEPCDPKSEAYIAGYQDIAQIGKERIRRAGKKVKEDAGLQGQNLDIGFRVLKVDTSNMKDVYYKPDAVKKAELFDQIENIKEDRTPEDLLFQVLLDWGVDLSLAIAEENIDGKTVFFVDQNALAACFDTGITEELVKKLAARKPLRAVFRDSGFGSDAVKINVEQIFKLISPGTEVKAI
jgi:adenine-specific DNA-methyltransferase